MGPGGGVKVSVRVEGYPPKKDGRHHMWTNREDALHARTLREAFAHEMAGRPAFAEPVVLEIDIHVPATDVVDAGDLDHWVGGICDALQFTTKQMWRACEDWKGVAPEAAPDRPLVLADDGWVTEIHAAKSTDADAPYYTVSVAPLAPQPV